MVNRINRRPPPYIPPINRQPWDIAKGPLWDFLRKMWDGYSGIPGGFKGTAAIPVIAGVTGDATSGTESASWMAADAQLVVLTGVPSGLSNTNTEGTSTRVTRLDHQHKRDVRVQAAGSDVGTRNAVNFSADFLVADNPGSDRVDVSLNVSPEEALIVALMAL
jgi:hypothetical protein